LRRAGERKKLQNVHDRDRGVAEAPQRGRTVNHQRNRTAQRFRGGAGFDGQQLAIAGERGGAAMARHHGPLIGKIWHVKHV
jgi:hypothetical protein